MARRSPARRGRGRFFPGPFPVATATAPAHVPQLLRQARRTRPPGRRGRFFDCPATPPPAPPRPFRQRARPGAIRPRRGRFFPGRPPRVVQGSASATITFTGSLAGSVPTITPGFISRTSGWRILTGPAAGGYEQELTAAQDRRLTARLKDPSELGLTINARHAEAAGIDELTTDAHVLWTSPDTGVTWNLFRGRVGSTSDTLDADRHRMTVAALDYRAVLARRRLLSGEALNNNPQFEAGLWAWTGAGGTLEAVDDQHQDGAKSGRITPTGADATVSVTSDDIAVTVGTTYRLSGWVRCAVARSVTLKIDWKNGGGGVISSSSVTQTLAAEEWTRFEGDAVAPATTANAAIVLQATGTPPATDIMWLDDARLTTAPRHASPLAWTAEDQANIAWGLIDDTQAREGGDLGITNGSSATGIVRDRVYAYGDSVGDRIKELGQTEGGFDWDVVPASASELTFLLWHEERGTSRGVVLEYGGAVEEARREVQPSEYANAIRMTGDSVTTATERQADDIATVEQGRWDAVFGDSGLTTQAALDERAHWQMKESQVIKPSWTVRLRRGFWKGPDHIWLGDTVRLIVQSGRLSVDTNLRVFELSFGIEADGGETVDLALNAPAPDHRRIPLITDRRLVNLERR